jgi:hypothetical protein
MSLTEFNVPINELLYTPDSTSAKIELSIMEIVVSEIAISASSVDVSDKSSVSTESTVAISDGGKVGL